MQTSFFFCYFHNDRDNESKASTPQFELFLEKTPATQVNIGPWSRKHLWQRGHMFHRLLPLHIAWNQDSHKWGFPYLRQHWMHWPSHRQGSLSRLQQEAVGVVYGSGRCREGLGDCDVVSFLSSAAAAAFFARRGLGGRWWMISPALEEALTALRTLCWRLLMMGLYLREKAHTVYAQHLPVSERQPKYNINNQISTNASCPSYSRTFASFMKICIIICPTKEYERQK